MSANRVYSACPRVPGSLTVSDCLRLCRLPEARPGPDRPWGTRVWLTLIPPMTLKLMRRQDRNMRYILSVDLGTKFSVRSGNKRLPGKIGSGRQNGIPVAYRGTSCSWSPRSRPRRRLGGQSEAFVVSELYRVCCTILQEISLKVVSASSFLFAKLTSRGHLGSHSRRLGLLRGLDDNAPHG